MGEQAVLDILAVTDIHNEHLPVEPSKTIEKIVEKSDDDFFVNLGDNSGEYNLEIKKIAEDCNFPFVSVLGNHDVRELDLPSFEVKRQKYFSNFFDCKITSAEKTIIKKNGYGAFNVEKYFAPLFDHRAYYIRAKIDTGNVGLLFRHFQYYFEKDPINKQITELVCNNNLNTLYIVSGHRHRASLSVECKQYDLYTNKKEVPIFNVVLPPFTLGIDQEKVGKLGKNKTICFAGLYSLHLLENGALKMEEVYLKNKTVKTKKFEPIKNIQNIQNEIAIGDLLVKA